MLGGGEVSWLPNEHLIQRNANHVTQVFTRGAANILGDRQPKEAGLIALRRITRLSIGIASADGKTVRDRFRTYPSDRERAVLVDRQRVAVARGDDVSNFSRGGERFWVVGWSKAYPNGGESQSPRVLVGANFLGSVSPILMNTLDSGFIGAPRYEWDAHAATYRYICRGAPQTRLSLLPVRLTPAYANPACLSRSPTASTMIGLIRRHPI